MEREIKKKTFISTISLFFQSGYSAFLGFVANLILTIVVSPATFGIYIAVLSIISIFNYFSDIGLSAALIQKKEVSDDDLKTTFTVQQLLILTLIFIGFLLTPYVKNFYHLPSTGVCLYYTLLISFFISSLKTIPSIKLEKNIEFQKIVLVQIIENTLFYIAVIIFSLLGFDLLSFAIAVILRAFVGLILIYQLSHWKIQIGFNKQSFNKLINFGLPFQTNSLLALIKDDLTTLFLGKILGFEKLGYLGFAKKWAEAPIRIIMDNISKVIFPLMAKFQTKKEKLQKIIEKILFYQSIIIIPATIGLIITLPYLMKIIPKYSKWQPTIPLLYLFAISSIFSSYNTPFINFFNSIGKVKISFKLMIFWTTTTWVLTPIFTLKFALYGFPLALIILSLTFIYVIYLAKKIVPFSFLKPIKPALVSSIIMIIVLFLISKINFNPFISLISLISLGIISYSLTVIFIFKINPIQILKSFYE